MTRFWEKATFKYSVLYALWLLLFVRILMHSWVSEDAYITFRVIDNFVNGYGLRWNVAERVQAYTHPLWLLIHLPLAGIWPNLFHLNIALSIFFTSAAVAVVLFTFRNHSLRLTVLFFLLPLLLSKTFMDYSSSGLETPLSIFLFAVIGYVVIHLHHHRFFWLYISLASALLLLNRLDHALMVAPILIAFYLQKRPVIWQVAIGFLPLVCWFGFSLFYYGFLFPNTKYAKLDTGFPLSAYLEQGFNYAFIWLTNDTASVALVICSFVMLWMRRKKIPPLLFFMFGGLVITIAYVIYIGGDYMMGRFWAFPFFVASWLLLAILPTFIKRDVLFLWAVMLATSYAIPTILTQIRTPCPTCVPIIGKVIDARGIFWRNGLFAERFPPKIREEGEYKFGRKGKEMAADPISPFRVQRFIGMTPYIVGARGIFIDELGLAVPLLSRLPAQTEKMFYVGHYRRTIPAGYMEAIRTDGGDTSKMDPDLAQYYEKILLITRGDLWDKERLLTIIRFNLGEYDDYKQRYLTKP